MDLLIGNAHEADTRGTGWFIGFSEWTRSAASGLLHVPNAQPLTGLCVKWYDHPDGHDSGSLKPVSEGRTVSILVSEGARFQLQFCERPDFEPAATRTVLLQRHGDFAAWGAGLYHRWRCLARATVLTVRWTPATAQT